MYIVHTVKANDAGEVYLGTPTANTLVVELPQTPRRFMSAAVVWAVHLVPS